jgi:hypothetical protein
VAWCPWRWRAHALAGAGGGASGGGVPRRCFRWACGRCPSLVGLVAGHALARDIIIIMIIMNVRIPKTRIGQGFRGFSLGKKDNFLILTTIVVSQN